MVPTGRAGAARVERDMRDIPSLQQDLIDEFIPSGVSNPRGVKFGPDGNLYVTHGSFSEVHRYDGTTGELLNVFVSSGSGGLDNSRGKSGPASLEAGSADER